LSKDRLEKFVVPYLSIDEQRAIVGVLGVVDSVIAKSGEVIAKTERLKKGLMQTLLTRGIGHKEYKQTPVGTIPKTWEVKRLEEASIEVTIGVVNPATPYYTSANDGVPYFRSQNVRENRLEPTNVYVKREFNERHPRSILKENDILTLQTGFIGVSCLVPKEYEGANCHSLLITRTNPKVLNPQFLCQFLNSAVGKKIIYRHNSGWGRAHLLLEDFRKIPIPIPPLQEQQTIAEILSTIDKKIEYEKKEKTRLERIKQGLMDLLLTGKIRVKVD
jgi:type I restriction enzyme S subunit